jgi:hypothetical protein
VTLVDLSAEGLAMGLLVLAGVSTLGIWACTLATVWYQRVGYDGRWRPRYDPGYRPTCAILVPCKGVHDGLAEGIAGLVGLLGEGDRLVLAVESEQDPACGYIREVIAAEPRAALVVAGLATTCAQMNHNLLAAVVQAGSPDVYVFADAQLRAGPGWLHELVLPLSDQGVLATSGFRWPKPSGPGLGQFAHTHAYLLLYTLFAFTCLVSNVGLWGGSMAIRRRDFDALGVAGLWAHTSTPDMSLSRLIVDRRGTTVLVPTCVTASDDLIASALASVTWFKRQCMYLKAHFPSIWALLMPLGVALLGLQLWLPVACVLSLLTKASIVSLGGAAAGVWLVGELVNGALFTLLGGLSSPGRYFLCLPLFRVVPLLGFVRTCFDRTILWSGVRYRVARSGKVISVER